MARSTRKPTRARPSTRSSELADAAIAEFFAAAVAGRVPYSGDDLGHLQRDARDMLEARDWAVPLFKRHHVPGVERMFDLLESLVRVAASAGPLANAEAEYARRLLKDQRRALDRLAQGRDVLLTRLSTRGIPAHCLVPVAPTDPERQQGVAERIVAFLDARPDILAGTPGATELLGAMRDDLENVRALANGIYQRGVQEALERSRGAVAKVLLGRQVRALARWARTVPPGEFAMRTGFAMTWTRSAQRKASKASRDKKKSSVTTP